MTITSSPDCPGSPLTAVIIQFAKWPQPGRVKTRLIPALGKQGALDAHIRLTLQVLDNLFASGLPVWLYWDRALAEPPQQARTILASADRKLVQQGVQAGENLGDRMTNALADGLLHADVAVIVGSDCPSVDADYLHQAVVALQSTDVVLGPSEDGGYVLIGARKTLSGMLDGIAWGTDQAYRQTVEALANAGLTTTSLATRWDVDEPEDWARFLAASFPDNL